MNDLSLLEQEVAALRHDVEMLKKRLPQSEVTDEEKEQTDSLSGKRRNAADRFLNELREVIQSELQEQQRPGGFASGFVTLAVNGDGKGSTTSRYSVITQTSADDLPSNQQLVEKAARLAAFAAGPLPLGAIRELLRPRFEKRPMQRSARKIAQALGTSLEELTDALAPLVASGTLKKSQYDGEELYEWSGNDLAALLLLHA